MRNIWKIVAAFGFCFPLLSADAEATFCAGCVQRPTVVQPQSGLWVIEGRRGQGLTLEVQDGVIAAVLYTHDAAGVPRWITFSGRAQFNSAIGVDELSATALETTVASGVPSAREVGRVVLRLYARKEIGIAFGADPEQRAYAFVFGTSMVSFFGGTRGQALPEATGESFGMKSWILTVNRETPGSRAFRLRSHPKVLWSFLFSASRVGAGGLQTVFSELTSTTRVEDEFSPVIRIACGSRAMVETEMQLTIPESLLSPTSTSNVCLVKYAEELFVGGPEDVSDSQINARNASGDFLQLVRVGYD